MVEGGDFSVNTEEVLTIGTINLEIFRHISLHSLTWVNLNVMDFSKWYERDGLWSEENEWDGLWSEGY